MTRKEAIEWFRAHADDEMVDGAERVAARALLGREPTAEDWDRIPELVGGAPSVFPIEERGDGRLRRVTRRR